MADRYWNLWTSSNCTGNDFSQDKRREKNNRKRLVQQMEKNGDSDIQQGEAAQKEKTQNKKQEQLINEVLTEVFQG